MKGWETSFDYRSPNSLIWRQRLRGFATVAAPCSLFWAWHEADAAQIGKCSGGNRAERQVTCIVDGDTGWERGVKWRMAGVDTPERGRRAACSAERRASAEATKRLIQLMRGGYRLIQTGKAGRYGRILVNVRLKDGRDAGRVLMREGLAQRWPNNRNPWC